MIRLTSLLTRSLKNLVSIITKTVVKNDKIDTIVVAKLIKQTKTQLSLKILINCQRLKNLQKTNFSKI